MKSLLISGLVSFGILGATGMSFFDNNNSAGSLVSPIVSVSPTIQIVTTPEPTPTASPAATPTAKPTVKKIVVTPKPTPTAEPTENVNKLIDKYSIQYGLDPNVFRHLAVCESNLRSNAVNGRYVGIFQYDSETWRKIRVEMGAVADSELRYSAEEAVKTTAFALSKGKSKLWPNCIP